MSSKKADFIVQEVIPVPEEFGMAYLDVWVVEEEGIRVRVVLVSVQVQVLQAAEDDRVTEATVAAGHRFGPVGDTHGRSSVDDEDEGHQGRIHRQEVTGVVLSAAKPDADEPAEGLADALEDQHHRPKDGDQHNPQVATEAAVEDVFQEGKHLDYERGDETANDQGELLDLHVQVLVHKFTGMIQDQSSLTAKLERRGKSLVVSGIIIIIM